MAACRAAATADSASHALFFLATKHQATSRSTTSHAFAATFDFAYRPLLCADCVGAVEVKRAAGPVTSARLRTSSPPLAGR